MEVYQFLPIKADILLIKVLNFHKSEKENVEEIFNFIRCPITQPI